MSNNRSISYAESPPGTVTCWIGHRPWRVPCKGQLWECLVTVPPHCEPVAIALVCPDCGWPLANVYCKQYLPPEQWPLYSSIVVKEH